MNDRSQPPRLPEAELRRVQEEAQAIASEVTGVRAVVVATEDGFDVAAVMRADLDAERVAALASSIAAIGQVVSAEARLGRSRSITVDTDEGFASIYNVPRSAGPALVLNVIAGADALLGQVHYRASQAARTLAS